MKKLLLCLFTLAYFISAQAQYSGFQRSLNDRPWGITIIDQKQGPVLAGNKSERFELRQGDCSFQPNWNDCIMDRERVEMSEMLPYTQLNVPTWYSWAVYFDPSWPDISPVTTTVGQFHQRNVSAPAVLFIQRNGVYYMRIESAKVAWPENKREYLLVDSNQLRSQWHYILVHANWSTGADGFVKVWVNNELKVEIYGQTTANTTPIFFKYGIYRSFVSRQPLRPTQILYIDEVRKGPTRESVDLTLKKIKPLN